jgi:hypothetical protein
MGSEEVNSVPITISAITESDQMDTSFTTPKIPVANSPVMPGSQDSMGSNQSEPFFAPPDDLLTHFDIVNTHVMSATQSLHNKMEALSIDQALELRKNHAQVISSLNQQFGEVYERIRTVEHDVGRLIGSGEDNRDTITSKLDTLATTIQTSVIKRLDEELAFRSELARRVDHFAFQLQETQICQQYIIDILKLNGLHVPEGILSPTMQSPAPTGRFFGPAGISSGMFINGQYHRANQMGYSIVPTPVSPEPSISEAFRNQQTRSNGQKPKEDGH